MQKPIKPQNINVDVSKIPDMKCWCGSDLFIRVRKLKYVSAFIVGDPKGATFEVFKFACVHCRTIYPSALPQSEVEKFRPINAQKNRCETLTLSGDLRCKLDKGHVGPCHFNEEVEKYQPKEDYTKVPSKDDLKCHIEPDKPWPRKKTDICPDCKMPWDDCKCQ